APPCAGGAAFPPPPPPLPADGGGPAAKAAGQLDAEDAGAAALICGDLVRCWAGCLVEVAFLRRCKLRAVQDEQFDLAQIAKSQEPEARPLAYAHPSRWFLDANKPICHHGHD
ncbi:unnamed protein product, partial [Prorocentrum cordatum]